MDHGQALQKLRDLTGKRDIAAVVDFFQDHFPHYSWVGIYEQVAGLLAPLAPAA